MIITGFNLIMGLVGSIQMLRRYVITRNIIHENKITLRNIFIRLGVRSGENFVYILNNVI